MTHELRHWFAPSLDTVRKAFGSFLEEEDSILTLKGEYKNCIRTHLAEGVTLPVPLVGGNSILKHAHVDFERLMISDHGNWQRKHLGAWQAVYGKTPYYVHLFPKLENAYLHHSHGKFTDFTETLMNAALDFLEIDSLRASASEMRKLYPGRFEHIREELLRSTDSSLTIFDSIFYHGKSTAFLLL